MSWLCKTQENSHFLLVCSAHSQAHILDPSMPKDSPQKKRKPRITGKPYSSKPGPKPSQNIKKKIPRTSAITQEVGWKNLTRGDWFRVFDFVHAHTTLSQDDVVEHFSALAKGALVFTQPSLSRSLKKEAKWRATTEKNPNELSITTVFLLLICCS